MDTNVRFHTVDRRDPVQRAKATALLAQLAQSGTGYVSTQIANEFATNLIKKAPGNARGRGAPAPGVA